MKRFNLLLFTVFFTLASYSQKDTIRLKTGETLIGQILDDDESIVVIKVDGKTKSVSKSEIGKKVEEKKAVEVKALVFSSVITVDEQNKAAIYSLARIWIAENFKSEKDVIQMEDKEAGIIVGKGASKYNASSFYAAYEGWINYTFKIQVKDGKMKFEMYNFIHENLPGNARSCQLGLITTAEKYTDKGLNKSFHNNTWKEIKADSELEFTASLIGLTGAVSGSIKDNNW